MERQHEIILFGGGCFWCTEAVFKMLKGVKSVTPGYSGGIIPNPTYEDVVRGDTDYAEVSKVEYDPALIKLRDLLTVFFASHDPTSLNKQGNDVGTQYRSAIFVSNQEQRKVVQTFIDELNASSTYGKPIVTEVEPIANFYEAEDYHKNYYELNKNKMYCQIVINPKLEKVQKEFAALLDSASAKE